MIPKNAAALLLKQFVLLAIAHSSFHLMYAQNKQPRFTVRLITLDPGHFHAALVQKSMYANIDSTVHVYAPKGKELDAHLALIDGYNSRAASPTRWIESVYSGEDYLEKMLAEKKGNLVVLAGNNKMKTAYIGRSVHGGINVLSDKPMAINQNGFTLLEKAFAEAKNKKLLLYDIMTERFQVTNALQRELSMIPAVFGKLQTGTEADPAVIKESVHHFFKTVSGKPLIRPAWYFDVEQEGEGIVDITTHLVDLVQWECFPGIALNYKKDIQINNSRHWATAISPAQFTQVTGLESYPSFLTKYIQADSLQVYANGSFNYTIKGIHARVSVTWRFEAPPGAVDTHYSIMKGTKANLIIQQEAEQQYKPVLYLEAVDNSTGYEIALNHAIQTLSKKYRGLGLQKSGKGWIIIVPAEYELNHEACFAEVMKRYIFYLQQGYLPDWEVPNMLAKYYTTLKALQMAATAK